MSALDVALAALQVDVNQRNTSGRTLFHETCAQCDDDIDVLYELVEHGANPNLLDDQGMTPWQLAVRHKRLDVSFYRMIVEIEANGPLSR